MGARRTVDYLRRRLGFVSPPEELACRARAFIDVKSRIRDVLRDGPKNIPEIAAAIGLDMRIVSWYVATLLRNGIVRIAGKDDEDRYVFVWVGEEL